MYHVVNFLSSRPCACVRVVDIHERCIRIARVYAMVPQERPDDAPVQVRSSLHSSVDARQAVASVFVSSSTEMPGTRDKRWRAHVFFLAIFERARPQTAAAAASAVRAGRTYGITALPAA